MGKGRTLKDLRNVSQLFAPQQPEGSFVEELARQDALPPPTVDIDVAVLSLMSNYRSWTVGDVQQRLKQHPDVGTVPALMNKFAHEGKFEIMAITGRANTYTLKRTPVETITSARNKAAPFVHRDPVGTRQAMDPKGVITLSDSIDLAVWKVMADCKGRTPGEIRQILVEYKFDGRQVDRRLDTLIRNNRWFDRVAKGRGRDTVYTMKKNFPMPAVANNEPMLPAAFSNMKENLSDAIVSKFTPPTMDFSGHMGHSAGAMDRGLEQLEQAIAQERAEQKEDDIVHQAAAADPVELPQMDYTILADDSNAQAIWKAIHDHKWYTTPDIQLLVQVGKPDINVKAVATLLTKLFQEGMLERKPVEGKAYFNYRLKEGTPMPADNRLQHRVPKAQQEAMKAAVTPKAPEQSELPSAAAAPAVQEAPVQEPAAQVEAQSQTDNTETMNTNTAAKPLVEVVNNAPAAVAVPLIELAIPLKGEKFTFTELRQLVSELQALGYGRASGAAQKLSIVSQTVKLKGIEFQKDELDTIVKALVDEGFGKHLQPVR